MVNLKELLTAVSGVLAIIFLFIPGMFSLGWYYYSWETYDRPSFFTTFGRYYLPLTALSRIVLIIALLLIVLVLVSQILKITKVNMPILYNKNFFLVTIVPLAWFFISTVFYMIFFSVLYSGADRITPFVVYFVELILLAVPLILNFIPGLDKTIGGPVQTPVAAGNVFMEEPKQIDVAPELTEEKIASLKEYKELVDIGALTAEEFEKIKKDMLGL
ncbi:MAG: SHOCT domain-containing protein [Bacillota bacterium]|nr:SHOCT domain-containing protein [Bacillota bacterium]